jgi:hypothetical protein
MTLTHEILDLGHTMTARYMTGTHGNIIGLVETHRIRSSKRSRVCGTYYLLFDVPEARQRFPGKPLWRVTSRIGEPLTLWPSVLCETCGNHGFITDGLWYPDG